MNILVYTPFNSRSRDTESVMEIFVKKGYNVFLYTQAQPGAYHEACKQIGVTVLETQVKPGNKLVVFLKRFFELLRLVKQHKVDFVYAHLEPAGMVAVVAQYFMKAKVIVFRHIVDEAYLFRNRNFIIGNKIVYGLARHVVVVSGRSKQFMVEQEKINGKKIKVINLGYNFSLYSPLDQGRISALREKYKASVIMLTVCRLVEPKRPHLVIDLVAELTKAGKDVQLIVLGKGPMEEELQAQINRLGLVDRVHLEGHVSNVLEYLSAADVLVHPSILDSSSVIVKEAGLIKKPVICCHEVGDFDEYLVHGKNAFMVERENPLEGMKQIILQYFIPEQKNPAALQAMGESLNEVVNRLFSIENVFPEYEKLNKELK